MRLITSETSFKFKVALEAAKGLKTINYLAAKHQRRPGQVGQWEG